MPRLVYILSPWQGDDTGAAMYPKRRVHYIYFSHITADKQANLPFLSSQRE